MITMLSSNKKYRFIWAEISFLSLWWNQATTDQRQLLIKLVNNKQFEIVTGGWVNIKIRVYIFVFHFVLR
jgi:alpha-mannosidase II